MLLENRVSGGVPVYSTKDIRVEVVQKKGNFHLLDFIYQKFPYARGGWFKKTPNLLMYMVIYPKGNVF